MKRYHTSFPSWVRGFDSPRPLIFKMQKFFTLTICLIIVLTNNLYPQNISPLYDFFYIIKSPFNTEKNNIKLISIFSATTISLFLVDENIKNYVQKNKSKQFENFLFYPEKMGDGRYILGLSGIFILSGVTFNDKKILKLGIYTTETFFISGNLVSLIKFITGRARPYTEKGSFYFEPFNTKTAYTSFYSGHTTVAFAFASTISHFTKNIYISSFLYAVATLVGIQRIYSNAHYSSDVFAGAFIGILIGKKVIELNEANCKSEEVKIVLWKKKI